MTAKTHFMNAHTETGGGYTFAYEALSTAERPSVLLDGNPNVGFLHIDRRLYYSYITQSTSHGLFAAVFEK